MPSGSHGGHSGSHGGSHHSSSHHSSGSRSVSRSRRPMHFYIGRTRYVVRSGASAFVSFLVIIMFFAIFGIFTSWALKSSADSTLKEIKADYIYYQNMISKANENPDKLVIDGTVVSKFYNSAADKWYVTYFFIADDGMRVEGYTFSVYTAEEAFNFSVGDSIKLAVDGYPTNSLTDSIPLDYADMPIEQDGEYMTFAGQRNGARTAMIVCGSAIGGIIVLSIVIMFTNKVKVQEENIQSQKKQTFQQSKPETFDEDLNADELLKQKHKYCEFCGAEMERGQMRCGKCRSKQLK